MIQEGSFYTGIGSRSTPDDVMTVMSEVAAVLERRGLILRSGGADGADTAFERGVSSPGMKEIYLPWRGFNGRDSDDCILLDDGGCHEDIAAASHPAWAFLKRGSRALHTRNVAQVLGMDCVTPSSFVLCWTPKGEVAGGTATVMRIAMSKGIPVLNLYYSYVMKKIENLIFTGEISEDMFDV